MAINGLDEAMANYKKVAKERKEEAKRLQIEYRQKAKEDWQRRKQEFDQKNKEELIPKLEE